MASCKSCGEAIEWAEWDGSGKAIPLDVGARADGNLALVAGKVHRYTADDAKLARDRRVSHFATCKDAASWRRR